MFTGLGLAIGLLLAVPWFLTRLLVSTLRDKNVQKAMRSSRKDLNKVNTKKLVKPMGKFIND